MSAKIFLKFFLVSVFTLGEMITRKSLPVGSVEVGVGTAASTDFASRRQKFLRTARLWTETPTTTPILFCFFRFPATRNKKYGVVRVSHFPILNSPLGNRDDFGSMCLYRPLYRQFLPSFGSPPRKDAPPAWGFTPLSEPVSLLPLLFLGIIGK